MPRVIEPANCAACGAPCALPFFRMYAFLQTVGGKKKKSKAASLAICGACGEHSPSELIQRVGQFKASPSIFDSESRGGLQTELRITEAV